ncbi:MAG: energy transducer TonB, partial [Bacteroidetes bacterium]|nr:energy transducer TonB [Bacteroidota bacterium]
VSQLIHYPEYARRQGIEGELPIQVLVDKNGRIIAHKYTTENSVYFKDAVNPHLGKIRFKSASYNGKPMRAWITIQFDFKLADG